jgi:hypothetical protein
MSHVQQGHTYIHTYKRNIVPSVDKNTITLPARSIVLPAGSGIYCHFESFCVEAKVDHVMKM